jgi:glycerate kinase
MHVLIAPDKFKGVLDARSVATAIDTGVRRARSDIHTTLLPMADGGEGTLDLLVDAAAGNRREIIAEGPLGDAVKVTVGLTEQASTAVVELAKVSGYCLIPEKSRDPLKTSTYGLGQVLRHIIDAEIEKIILTLGGSATVDGGAGMMQALGMVFFDSEARRIERRIGGSDLSVIQRFAWERPPENLDNVQFVIGCDVLNPLCGPCGAAEVFGPQKGADAAGVVRLSKGLAHWADLISETISRDLRNEPGTGAAGGVALPLLAFTNASIVPGIDLVCETLDFINKLCGVDLVITGEGRIDRQSMMGKVVGTVARMARQQEIPCVAIVGTAGPGAIECLGTLDRYFTLDGPLDETAHRLELAAEKIAKTLL